MRWLLVVLAVVFLMPGVSGLICFNSGSVTASNYTFDFVGDSGGGSIADPDTLNFSGAGGISTSVSGMVLTIDGSGIAGASDTNESERVNFMVAANCGGTDKAVGMYLNGSFICTPDLQGSFTNGTSILVSDIESEDWTNVSVTEEQILDLSHTVNTFNETSVEHERISLTCENMSGVYRTVNSSFAVIFSLTPC